MSSNRTDRQVQQVPSVPVLAEVLRQGAEAGHAAAGKQEGGGLPVFWRIFGGTLLGIAAMVAVTVYQGFSNSLNDVRNDLGHLNSDLRKDLGRLSETQGDLVKKEELTGRVKPVWDAIGELRADRNALTTLKERSSVLTELFKAGEEERRQLAKELQQLREHQAAAEERKELVRELQQLREKLAQLEGRQAAPATPTPALHMDEGE
jgi:hypothetical protein